MHVTCRRLADNLSTGVMGTRLWGSEEPGGVQRLTLVLQLGTAGGRPAYVSHGRFRPDVCQRSTEMAGYSVLRGEITDMEALQRGPDDDPHVCVCDCCVHPTYRAALSEM